MTSKKLSLLPVFATVFIDFLGIAIVVPIFAPMLLDKTGGLLPVDTPLGMRGIILGFLIAIYPLGQFFGSPVFGKISDRHGRKPWLVGSLGGTALGYVISAIGIVYLDVTTVFVGRLICGFTGGNSSICQSAVADVVEGKKRAAYFGYLGIAMGVGFTLGPVLGGRLADPHLVSWFNFATPFWFSAILALFNMFFTLFIFHETLKVKEKGSINLLQGFADIGKAFKHPNLRYLFIIFFFFVLGWYFFAQFFQVYLIQKFHYNQRQIGDTYTYIALCYAILQIAVAGPLSSHIRPKLLVIISLPALGIFLWLLLAPQIPWPLYVIFPPLVLCVCLAWTNIMALLSNAATEKQQGEVLGINQSMNSLAQALTPILSGPMVAGHRNLPTIIAGVCCYIAWLLVFFTLRKRASSRSERKQEKLEADA